jgi:hypothetical protein
MAKGTSHKSTIGAAFAALNNFFERQFSTKNFFFGKPHFKSVEQWVHMEAIRSRIEIRVRKMDLEKNRCHILPSRLLAKELIP